jgi:transcription initiation factor TFIIH subunit 3
MDRVDGSDHYERAVTGKIVHSILGHCNANNCTEESPSLLTIILDTNPHAWAVLAPTLPLSKAIANLLVFINAHLAFNNANQVAVVASHSNRAAWLYPRPSKSKDLNRDDDKMDVDSRPKSTNDANKYRPFALIEHDILASVRELVSTTTEGDISSSTTTQMGGALTQALFYINKATINYSDSGINSSSKADREANDTSASVTPTGLQSRILVISVSGDLASQYITIMNATFAAQSLRIPIDIMKLAGDGVLLQQASDSTGGIYLQPRSPQGLLQYLMTVFLPDQTARLHLIAPTQDIVDFRAVCFCHRKVVDIGFVCSICLSSMPFPTRTFQALLTDISSFLLAARRFFVWNLWYISCSR